MRTGWQRLVLAAIVAAAAGCGSSSSTPTTPTAPAATTDTFSGSVAQSGADFHVFAVAANGPVAISLTSVSPLATMALGVSVATSDGTGCLATITQNANARSGSVALQAAAATTGSYCVQVYDSGNVPAGTTVAYTVQVSHP